MHRCYSTVALRGFTIACLVALTACAGNGIRLATAPDHPRTFDGHWVVDVSHSEDPDAAPGGAGRSGGMGGGHGHGGGGMGGGGRHGGGGTSGGGASGAHGKANDGDNGDMMRRALLLPNTLDIAMQPGSLLITPDGHPRSVPMVTSKDTLGDATRAGWDGDSLVVVIHIDDKRGDIVQHYEVAADHSRLVVTTEFKQKSKTVSLVREFTAAPPPAGAPAARTPDV
ncbi:MAG TPA: hypothetical protein VM621_10730 [Luteibacter sp.]|uniref:hypothetical protein n=1 Tax=Luteibacter sp. TaxID=1886636 RepID=UPI002D06AEB9|nr:hypothetical protein [Luteibacter sp.]HVI55510.1 hypothetical protein [Luteibacter sp.]